VRGLLGELLSSESDVTVVDMEAGLEHLSRSAGTLRHVDHLLVVVEPYAKAVETAHRVAAIIAERNIGRALVATNRVRSEQDLELIRAGLPGVKILTVPEDPRVAQADREARSPLDAAPDGPGVRAIAELAACLGRGTSQAVAADTSCPD
jgi:CO dehydrogenase maturation factor